MMLLSALFEFFKERKNKKEKKRAKIQLGKMYPGSSLVTRLSCFFKVVTIL